MSLEISLLDKTYRILDTREYITLADSFVINKIGTGHGEAKLYVGNESDRLCDFFGDFNCNCFFLEKDFEKFLLDAKDEYKNPQQNYLKKEEMPNRFDCLYQKLQEFDEGMLCFKLFRVDVKPPRVYATSTSEFYTFMRSIGLPNISYLSVLKLENNSAEILYYFKIFIDYKPDTVSYLMSDEAEQTQIIEDSSISNKKKETLIKARIGQGEYRNKLIEECMFCPFTSVNDERLLIASHIKPWSKSNDKEKIDRKNGFIFTPTFDKLFDKGFITFCDDKSLLVSPWLSPMNQKRLGIYDGKKIALLPLDEARIEYLKYHRENIFKS